MKNTKKATWVFIIFLTFLFLWNIGSTYRHEEVSCFFAGNWGDEYPEAKFKDWNSKMFSFSATASYSLSSDMEFSPTEIGYDIFPIMTAGHIENLASLTFAYDPERRMGRISSQNIFMQSGEVKNIKYGWFSPECWQKVALYRDKALPKVKLITLNWPDTLPLIPTWKK